MRRQGFFAQRCRLFVIAQLCRWVTLATSVRQITWTVAAMAAVPLLLLLTGFFEPDERERVLAVWKRFRGQPVGA